MSTFHMDVRYVRDGRPATARININDSSDAYHKGDDVTVIYDPAHPDRPGRSGRTARIRAVY